MMPLLQGWVARAAERRPEATALALGRDRLTYGELEESSNRLARVLREGGCRRGDRVCFLMPKSPQAIVSILGILKANAMYVPLDPSSPAARLARIAGVCEPRFLLAAGPVAPLLDQLAAELGGQLSIPVGWMGAETVEAALFRPSFTYADLAAEHGGPPAQECGPADAAYIFFTSGSTGAPKGVVITHSNVAHFIEWAVRRFGLGPTDRISGHPPLHFDLSVFDIFGSFAAGAQLQLVPAELNLLPHRLAAFIRECELTQWFSVPSVLNYMAKFDAVPFQGFPALKRLLWCGEVFPTPALKYWMERLPGVQFTNLYGPTESTIASSHYTVPSPPLDEKAEVPIGAPCEGEELLVLDDDLRPVPPGEAGNLFIAGVGLSPGYWRDPERTREAFLPDPRRPDGRIYRTGDLARVGEDGLVRFLGRADSQIKSRGYRIELGEIETALHALPYLEESAVVAVETPEFAGYDICCAYVPARGSPATAVLLKKDLSRVLPPYMLPSRWLAVDRLPLNPNGKVDRPRVKQEFQSLHRNP